MKFNYSWLMHGVTIYSATESVDSRGYFRKILTPPNMALSVPSKIEEVFYSQTKIGGIRGLHVQIGPAANFRFIHVSEGEIFDVLIDLRQESESFGQKLETHLSSLNPKVLVVPPGVAHGFQALSNATIMYFTTSSHSLEFDTGIHWDSIEVKWPIPITEVSERDNNLPHLAKWLSGELHV